MADHHDDVLSPYPCGCSPQEWTFCCEGRWLLKRLRRALDAANHSDDPREYFVILNQLHGHLERR